MKGETDLPGNFFLSFVYSRNLIMLDGKGNIVWSKHEDQPSKDVNTGFWDFKKHDVDGEVYSYLQEVKEGKVVWEFKSKDYPELNVIMWKGTRFRWGSHWPEP